MLLHVDLYIFEAPKFKIGKINNVAFTRDLGSEGLAQIQEPSPIIIHLY